ncbi:Qat anti-phage system TatD family nuclease QatD [Maricaulis maris]|uniref:TatD-related deoxyribonuclease n=2 Tax=Maricaulis maris TaxID=74318 RepID=Q0AM90_MARMM|nr:Qat anti-phage system TatD family nuclease QatD [Maricaulis maris]ABI66603.1 TatD-related deoxyribonuclease [Maricaulis maris MCS10]RKQ89524.1 TatD DNase family protein [Maricaulis maris]
MIDFHCHIDLYDSPALALDRALTSNTFVLSVTTTPKAFLGTQKLAAGNKSVQTALGFHPQLAHERADELALIDYLMPQARFVGEIGLDGSVDFKEYLELQKMVFRRMLTAAAQFGGRVMSIHSRGAATEVLDMLEQHPNAGTPVLHWFSGTKAELSRAVSLGAWFSVGPAMLKSAKGRELARLMPKGRVLTETDGPFATLKGRVLYPNDVRLAIDALSDIWGEGDGPVGAQITSNFHKLNSIADAIFVQTEFA